MFNNDQPLQLGDLKSAAVNQQVTQGGAGGYQSVLGGQQAGLPGGFSIPGLNVGNQSGGFSLGGILGQNGAQNLGLGLGALQTLGGLWNSYNTSKLAKESLGLQKEAFETNLKNNTKSYNTALEDRIRARYATEGRSGSADGYIEKHSL